MGQARTNGNVQLWTSHMMMMTTQTDGQARNFVKAAATGVLLSAP